MQQAAARSTHASLPQKPRSGRTYIERHRMPEYMVSTASIPNANAKIATYGWTWPSLTKKKLRAHSASTPNTVDAMSSFFKSIFLSCFAPFKRLLLAADDIGLSRSAAPDPKQPFLR
jgi:ABC-type phosphate/phosphonate transport system permease subunit